MAWLTGNGLNQNVEDQLQQQPHCLSEQPRGDIPSGDVLVYEAIHVCGTLRPAVELHVVG